MTAGLGAGDGVPRMRRFGGARPPSGTYTADGWQVDPAINTVVDGSASPSLPRRFRQRPDNYDAMIRASAQQCPEGEAVICGDRRVRWHELDHQVEQAAFGLIEAGLRQGDRVAIMLDNRLEFVVAALACVRAGGIAIPLGTRLGPADVAYIVGHAQPVLAVTARAWRSRFPDEGSIARYFLVDAVDPDDHFDALLQSRPRSLPTLQADDPMMLMYTSGTTGKPKGVVLTHTNFVHTVLHYLYALAIDEPQRSLLTIPASHIAGFGPVLSVTLASGGTLVLMREFDPQTVMATLERERVSYSVLVPAMIQLCAQHPSLPQSDLSAWRYCIYGGAIMPPAVIEQLASTLPHLRMINAYGATETCAVCTIIPHELTAAHPASVGLPLQCDDLIVVDTEDRRLPPGQSGELLIRGPNVFARYWNDATATAAAFEGDYWRSGDIGMIDERGLVTIQDRVKDMINRGGFKVFSAEVETTLITHPRVADCAVVAVPHPVLGEKVFAFVQARAAGVGADELKEFLLARIADYKVPDFWEVGQAPLPRNQNGKMQKAILREQALVLQKERAARLP